MTYVVASDVDLRELEEAIAFGARLNNLFEYQVHPVIAIDQVSIQRLAVLKLDEHRVALGRGEEA